MASSGTKFLVEFYKPVKDLILRRALQTLASVAKLHLVVVSGDRAEPVKGGSVRSLHMLGCAADLWMPGYGTGEEQRKHPEKAFEMSKVIFDAAQHHARVVFRAGHMYEVLLHGLHSRVNMRGGKAGQPHCHIGRDPNSHLSAIQFKVEGKSPVPATARAAYQQSLWVELS